MTFKNSLLKFVEDVLLGRIEVHIDFINDDLFFFFQFRFWKGGSENDIAQNIGKSG